MARSRQTSQTSAGIAPLRTAVLTTLLLCGLLACAGLITSLTHGIMRPIIKAYAAGVATKELRAAVEAQRRQNARQEHRKKRLESAEGVIEEGRQHGMVTPGEYRIRFQPRLPAQPAPATAAAAGASPADMIGFAVGLFVLTFVFAGVPLYRRLRAARAQQLVGALTPRRVRRRRR